MLPLFKNDDLNKIINDRNHPLREHAYNLRKDLEKLHERAATIKSLVEQVQRRINSAHIYRDGEFHVGVNSLGELQSSAATFEISCALVERSEHLFNKAMHDLQPGE